MQKLRHKYRNISAPVKASFWFMICGFMQRGISVLTTPIFTRLLTTEQYGTYSVFNSWLEVLTVFITLKLAAGVFTQGLVKNEEDRDVFTSSLLGLATTSTFAWLVIYLLFHRAVNALLDLSTLLMLAMFAMMWSTIAYNFWSARERVDYKYRNLVILTIIVSVMKPVLSILAILMTPVYKAEARILALAAVEVAAYTGLFIHLMRKGKVFYHKKYWIYALKFNLPLIPHYLSKTVLNHSDRLMIKAIVGSSAAGVYSLAYNISSILLIFNNSVTNSLTPWIYKSIKGEKIKNIGPICYMILAMIGGINLFLIAIAPEAVAVFAPRSYGDAIWAIPPVTMSVFFQFMYSLFASFEFYYEKTRWVMAASVIGAVLNVVLNAVFIPIYGYIAAAYTTLFCYFVYSMLHYVFMRKVCRKYADDVQPFRLSVILGMSAGFVALGFALMALFPWPAIRFALLLVACVVIFLNRARLMQALKVLRKGKQKEQ